MQVLEWMLFLRFNLIRGSCITLDKSLIKSELQRPHLKNKVNKRTCIMWLLRSEIKKALIHCWCSVNINYNYVHHGNAYSLFAEMNGFVHFFFYILFVCCFKMISVMQPVWGHCQQHDEDNDLYANCWIFSQFQSFITLLSRDYVVMFVIWGTKGYLRCCFESWLKSGEQCIRKWHLWEAIPWVPVVAWLREMVM